MLNDDTKEHRQKKNGCERTKRQEYRENGVSQECPQKNTKGAEGRTEDSVRGTFNRQYQDRLFKAIFGREEHKAWLLSLYNALNGSSYTDPSAIEINTIEGIIYVTMKNDISFLIDSQLNLYEQQSSYNPNMPLRGLMYFSQLYQKYISKQRKDIYSSALLKIPTPQFIVIYTGSTELDDIKELKLSDSFEVPDTSGRFEWTATVVNISRGHSRKLLEQCPPLRDYAVYVSRIKGNVAAGMTKEDAVNEAMEYSIEHNLLNGYFLEQKMEVLNMSLTEFDQEEYDRNRFNDGKEVGIAIGIAEGERKNALQNARNFIRMGIPLEQIAKGTELPLETVLHLQEEMAVGVCANR
ncbi:MAG: hypothetical protein MR917_05130 [Treponema porcinum]|nr:hypothetical protein [Treponema porcinum]